MDNSFVIRKFQRSIAGLSLLAILASFAGFGTAFASSFPDVSSDYFAYDQIDALSDAGVMTGNDDGTFAPDRTLNRAEAAKILLNAFGIEVDSSYDADFSDVDSSAWYAGYVNNAAQWGIVSGYSDGTYRPEAMINRAEFAKMVVLASGLDGDGTMGSDIFTDVESADWFSEYVGILYVNSVADGTSSTTFSPANEVSRGAAAKMTYNAMYPVYRGDSTDETTSNSDAVVTVEVSNDTPTADTIPSGATSVALASFDFTAEGDDAMLEGFTVHQYGVSSVPSGAMVYLYEGSQRLTNGTSVNSTTHESEFRNVDVELNDGDTVTLTVRMDMGTWSGSGEVGFEVESADMVDVGTATVEGDFAVQGEKFSVASSSTAQVGSITIEKNGTVENAQVGEDGSTVAKFKLTSGSSEGGEVRELGLYVAGTISTADVENFNLYVTGDDAEPIAQVDNVDDLDVVRFVVGEGEGVMDGMSDGYSLAKGASKSFYVTADFNTGRTDDSFKMYVDQSTDVFAVGDLYGYGLSVTRTGYDGDSCTTSAGDCSYMTLEGGDVTVSSNGPTANDIAVNADDVVFLNFTVTSVADVTFDNFPVAFTASESSDTDEGLLNATDTSSPSNFTGITIMDTDSGDALYSSVDVSAFATGSIGGTTMAEGNDSSIAYYLWTDDWEVEAGAEYNLSVQADVKNDTDLAGMTVYATLPFGTTYPTLKDVNNKVLTNSTVLVPTSSIVGKTMTVQSAGLTFSLASTAQSDTYVKGSDDVNFACFTVRAGAASSIELDELTLTASFDENSDGTYSITGTDNSVATNVVVPSVWLTDSNGDALSDAESVTSSGTVVFQDLNLAFDAAESMTLCATADISSNGYQNGNADKVAFGIASASSVSATDEDGSTLASAQISGLSSALNEGTSAPDVVITVSGGGTLVADLGSARPREDIVVAGETDVEIAQFKFTATDEDFSIDKLSVFDRYSSSAVTSSSVVKSYDDAVTQLYIEYTDSEGNTVESDPVGLTNSNAQLTGLDIWVPKDGETTITLKADLQTISGGADAGDFVDFNLALNNFRATAQGSGETYDAADMDDTNASGSITDSVFSINGFDDSSFVNTVAYANDAADLTGATTVGSSASFSVDNDAGADQADLAVGTFLCVTGAAATSCDVTSDDIYVVTTWTDGSTEDTVTGTLVTSGDDGTYTAGDNILYAVPGQQYLDGSYQMVVYETQPTVALSSSSPSGSRTVSATDTPFVFTVSNMDNISNQAMQIRAAQVNNASATTADFQTSALDGTYTGLDAISAPVSGGIGNSAFVRETSADNVSTAGITYTFGAAANLGAYKGLSYWTRSSTAESMTLTVNDDGVSDPTAGGAAVTANTWTFVDLAFDDSTTTARDVVASLAWVTDATPGAAATFDIDRVVLYYEKVSVDVTTSGDVDTNGTDLADNLVAYLKEGGTTLATGYWYSSSQSADASTSSVTFYPETNVDQTIEIADGASKTITLQTDTASLLDVESEGTETNGVTFSMDMGTSANGTVTAGDFWWYESNATAKWLGYVSNSTLSGNTLTY